MKMKALLAGASMALGLSLLGAAGAANAGALYQQAWDGSSNFYASQNDSGSNGNFATVADDFKLSSASTVTGVEFVGAFFNPATAMTINNFTINFYADNAGKPGAQVGTASGAPTVVSLGSPVPRVNQDWNPRQSGQEWPPRFPCRAGGARPEGKPRRLREPF